MTAFRKAEKMLQFVYDYLQPGEIRLLQPIIVVDGTVKWSLETVHIPDSHITNPVEFDALSYTWGDPAETFPLICNDQELRIHKNLHEALPYLARRGSSKPIWIDAICINQTDDEEKLVQVRKMHQVYRQASKVWIWLGCASEHSETAIALFPSITRATHARMEEQSSTSIAGMGSSGLRLEHFGLPEVSSPVWPAVYDIIFNRWFYRLWIVQEFALAREAQFILGPYEIDSKIIGDVVRQSYVLRQLPDAKGQKLEYRPIAESRQVFTIRNKIGTWNTWPKVDGIEVAVPGLLISVVYNMTGTCDCFDPRDRVWGILGFLYGVQPEQLKIDSGMTLTDLYTRLANYLFTKADQSVVTWWGLLDRATFADKRSDLPSWCPDFHQRQEHAKERTSISADRYSISPQASASRSHGMVRSGASFAQIILRGTVFDILLEPHPLAPSLDDFHQMPNYRPEIESCLCLQGFLRLQEWDDLVSTAVNRISESCATEHAIPLPRNEGEQSRDMYWRTIVANEIQHDEHSFTYETLVEVRNALRKLSTWADKDDGLVRSIIDTQNHEALDELKLDAEGMAAFSIFDTQTIVFNFLVTLNVTLRSRRLFSTLAARLGYGPIGTQKGDVLCVFDGATVAHVLRRADERFSGVYSLIGECYVHGMMDGEIELMGLKKEDITLV